jgi:F1F0 ATPase subunit 2
MNETYELFVSFLTGLVIGIIFFYGLWRTIKVMPTSKTPAIWMLGSAISRIGLLLLGFYFVTSLGPEGKLMRISLCFIGILIARFIVTKTIEIKDKTKRKLVTKEVHSAP